MTGDAAAEGGLDCDCDLDTTDLVPSTKTWRHWAAMPNCAPSAMGALPDREPRDCVWDCDGEWGYFEGAAAVGRIVFVSSELSMFGGSSFWCC